MGKNKNYCHCSIKIENLSVKYSGNFALRNVSLDANHGEILAIIGQNGAGKTTLLKTILKCIDFKGEITFFNSDGEKISNPKIGYVPQKLTFEKNTPVTVLDLFCTNSTKLPVWIGHQKYIKEKALEILKKVGSENLINKTLGTLSGGELQKVLLAFALEPIPDILLLDEPVSAVDKCGADTFYSLIVSMRKDFHMPIIIVSHDLQNVKNYATKFALLDKTVLDSGFVKNIEKSKKVSEVFGIKNNKIEFITKESKIS